MYPGASDLLVQHTTCSTVRLVAGWTSGQTWNRLEEVMQVLPRGVVRCRVVMHVDMDCFFASVAVRNRPELQGIPLAIAHSNHSAGHSEISCVNYIARRCGVRADMWMASARERCDPDLVVIPYEFDAYQEVSERMYRILLQHATLVQPMSCDEAYVDVSDCSDPVALAATLRRQIRDATRCNASVGIGPSILLAAMATKKAKPDGVFRVLPQVLPARHRPARAPRPARSHRAHHRHVPGVAGG